MPRLTRMLCALAALALLGSLGLPAALADDPCRRKVVVYLDVSGSMYEEPYKSSPPWAGGHLVTLMESTVHFLEKGLLAPGSLAVCPGDTLTLRGFYSLVDSLADTVHGFKPEEDAPRLGREVFQRLDFNQNGEYDIGDAAPHRNKKTSGIRPKENTFLAVRPGMAGQNWFDEKKYVRETDFANVVEDMITKFNDTPLGPGGPQDFDKLVFIILTDGGQENQDTQDKFKKKIKQAGELMQAKIAEGRVQVFFFGVTAANHGAYLALKDRENVSGDFREHFQANLAQLDMTTEDLVSFNKRLASLAERIEIEPGTRASYQYLPPPDDCQPSDPPPEGKIVAKLNLANHACGSLTLQEVRGIIYATSASADHPATSQAGRTPVDSFDHPVNQTLGGRGGTKFFLNQEISLPRRLEPGRYQLELAAVSKDLGPGLKGKTLVDLKVPPPPPCPDGNILFWILLKVLGAVLVVGALGVLTWYFWPKRER